MYSALEVAKYILPSIVVLAASILIIREFLLEQKTARAWKTKHESRKHSLPLQLQAYERLTLFLERTNPGNLISRVRQPDMSSSQLQLALINTIRQEYEHNVAQQIYISSQAWNMIVLVKDELIKVITSVGQTLPADAPSRDFSTKLLQFFMDSDGIPNQKAMDILKAEARGLF